jgi:hypothetical protein
MKKLFFVYVFAALLAFAFESQAQDMAVLVGMRSDSADSDVGTTTKIESKTNWQAGGLAFIDLMAPMKLRSGFIYSNRNYAITTPLATTTGDIKLAYFDVPVGVMYKMGDYGGPFVGAVLALNVSKSCPGGSCEGVNSTPLGFQLGASFKFAPQLGAELYYESFSGTMLTGVKDSKAVVANLLFTFD